jgi:hypothetical protein
VELPVISLFFLPMLLQHLMAFEIVPVAMKIMQIIDIGLWIQCFSPFKKG